MRSLTIAQACAESNIWFKVESEEERRRFQEEFFRQGGSWLHCSAKANFDREVVAMIIDEEGALDYVYNKLYNPCTVEQVSILWQEPSLTLDSLAPETTLAFTLDTSKSWQDTLAVLTQLKNEELVKDFISDKCLRRMEAAQLASLARFLLEKQDTYCVEHSEEGHIVKSFILTTKNYLTKRTKQLEYWYKFYRKEVERVVREAQAGLYQEELKNSPEWEELSWERRGEA